MKNDVIYIEPKLNLWQKAKDFWNYVNIYPEGLTKEFKLKKELEQNMEGNLKDNQKKEIKFHIK